MPISPRSSYIKNCWSNQVATDGIAAATKIWRRMFTDELTLATNALKFMKSRWQG